MIVERWPRWGMIAVLVAGVAWIIITRPPSDLPVAVYARAGFAAPDLALPAWSQTEVRLTELRGQVVIVNFWASWCGPCRAELPTLERMYQADQARGLTILAVNSTAQDDETAVLALWRDLDLSMPLLFDREGDTTSRYGVRMLPTTFIIDRHGVIRQVFFGGPLSEATLRSVVNPLLDE